MKISHGCIVRVEYELKVKGGEVIESSARSGPLQYVHGGGKMLPGLESRLEGLTVGDERTGTIPAAEAFGTEESLPVRELPRKEFPAGEEIEVGKVFAAKGPAGEPIQFQVVEAGADQVKVRFLHPLAGKDIDFRVKVLLIDDPTAKKRIVLAPPPPPADALDVAAEEVDEG
jgi:FKBP-type peptidyl-prolyl cis-trans isomerase SlyD